MRWTLFTRLLLIVVSSTVFLAVTRSLWLRTVRSSDATRAVATRELECPSVWRSPLEEREVALAQCESACRATDLSGSSPLFSKVSEGNFVHWAGHKSRVIQRWVWNAPPRLLALPPAPGIPDFMYERTIRRVEAEAEAAVDRMLLYEALYLLRFSQAENLGQRLSALRMLRELCHDWHHAVQLRDLGAVPLVMQALSDPNALIRAEAAQLLATASQNHFEFQQSVRAAVPALLQHASDVTETLPVRSACLRAAVVMAEAYRVECQEDATSTALQIIEQAMEMCSMLCTTADEHMIDMHRFVRRSFALVRSLIGTISLPEDTRESWTLPYALQQHLAQRPVRSRLEKILEDACLATDTQKELAALVRVLGSPRRSSMRPHCFKPFTFEEQLNAGKSLPSLQEPVRGGAAIAS